MAKKTIMERYRALTNAQRELVDAMKKTWDVVKADSLAAAPKNYMRRKAVIETVADHVGTYGADRSERRKVLAGQVAKVSDAELADLGEIAFPAPDYRL